MANVLKPACVSWKLFLPRGYFCNDGKYVFPTCSKIPYHNYSFKGNSLLFGTHFYPSSLFNPSLIIHHIQHGLSMGHCCSMLQSYSSTPVATASQEKPQPLPIAGTYTKLLCFSWEIREITEEAIAVIQVNPFHKFRENTDRTWKFQRLDCSSANVNF